MALEFTKDEAENFFSELFYGKHHIPGDIKEFGYGWQLNARTSMATTDFNNLTRLVLISHRDAIRTEINPSGPGMIKICIWKRKREGKLTDSHLTIEQAIESFKNYKMG